MTGFMFELPDGTAFDVTEVLTAILEEHLCRHNGACSCGWRGERWASHAVDMFEAGIERKRFEHPLITYRCPRCGMVSFNPNDAKHGYCGHCHAFTGDEIKR